ncbi:MAG: tRNA pseudouridine(13) synthase TruD [Thermodesulfovibrio sp.]|nr:tRNA pseudouridine(13) synthase TruD [Thermodesulfovibrio sp.]
MSYKIKVKADDFFVKEITNLPIKKEGLYSVYILKKSGWNTLDLLRRISQKFRIPFKNISYGGKKDRHATTEQYFTVKALCKDISLKEKNFSIEFVGFSPYPMGPKFIEGNQFKIAVRNIEQKEVEKALESFKKIKTYGFVNYFDDQRFGSFDPKQGFIAEKILKKHYSGALKIYLTHIHPEDKKEAKERKRKMFNYWGNWQECLSIAQTEFEKKAFNHLVKNSKDFLTILKKISKEELSMFFSAYQAFLWNEVVRRLILRLFKSDNLLFHKGLAGDYIFYKEVEENYWYIKDLKIPTPSSKAKMPDKITDEIYREVLNEREIKPSMFNLKKIRQAFFKEVQRDTVVIPKELYCSVEDDEIYKHKLKLTVEFVLPRGSYATMLIKRAFAKSKI